MNITDFESHISSTILKRGADYYNNEQVVDLKNKKNEWTATVQGTEDYEVECTINAKDEITDHYCDCPYDQGDVCKHQVALFFAIRNKMSVSTTVTKPKKEVKEKEAPAQNKKLIDQILSAVTEKEVKDFLVKELLKNPKLQNTFFSHFSSQTEIDVYTTTAIQMQNSFKEILTTKRYYDNPEFNKLNTRLNKIVTTLQKEFSKANYGTYWKMATAWIDNFPALIDKYDRGNDLDYGVQFEVLDVLHNLNNKLDVNAIPILLKEDMHKYLLNLANTYPKKGDEALHVLNYLGNLDCNVKDIRKQKIQILEEKISQSPIHYQSHYANLYLKEYEDNPKALQLALNKIENHPNRINLCFVLIDWYNKLDNLDKVFYHTHFLLSNNEVSIGELKKILNYFFQKAKKDNHWDYIQKIITVADKDKYYLEIKQSKEKVLEHISTSKELLAHHISYIKNIPKTLVNKNTIRYNNDYTNRLPPDLELSINKSIDWIHTNTTKQQWDSFKQNIVTLFSNKIEKQKINTVSVANYQDVTLAYLYAVSGEEANLWDCVYSTDILYKYISFFPTRKQEVAIRILPFLSYVIDNDSSSYIQTENLLSFLTPLETEAYKFVTDYIRQRHPRKRNLIQILNT